MDNTERDVAMRATFSPELGVVIGESVKDAVKRLLDAGYFDKATTLVIGVTAESDVSTYRMGSLFDEMALAGIIRAWAEKDYTKGT